MKVRATTDGQALLITHFNEVHNHDTSEFKLNPKKRRVGPQTEKEIANMISVNANRKMVQSHFSEKTGKVLLKSDIHNIATRAKQQDSQPDRNAVEDLAGWIKQSYPTMTSHVVRNENVVTGIYLQDPQMKSAFNRFPEVLLVDATHKTNDRGMVFTHSWVSVEMGRAR